MEQFLSPFIQEKEQVKDVVLRPQNFEEYIGQEKVVKNVNLMVESAKLRNQSMDHLLFFGPPGLGKTSLAMLVAGALNTQLHVISGPAIEKKGDLAAILTNLQPRDVLFIDEIHRMHISIEEILYSAMEDFRLDIMIGQGPSARTMQINLPAFTLIGATTRSGLLSNPLRDRFMAHLYFEFYNSQDLASIVRINANKMKITIDDQATLEIANRSRGTPRIANRVLRRVRDFCIVSQRDKIQNTDVAKALELMDIDDLGLDSLDRKILKVIKDYYSGGPVGIEALCATLGDDRNTIEDVCEPYLLKEGFLLRTPRGRVITEKALAHLAQNSTI